MSKKLPLIVFSLMLFSLLSYAQTGNYSAGAIVTPTINDYDGSTDLNAPGSSITSGDYDVLIGAGAGGNLSSGSQAVFIGTAAGALHTTQADNIFIGAFAGDQATTGTDNVVIGTRAARTLNGTDNTVIGVEAGMVMELGASDNTFIGEEAGQAMTTGDDNTFIGEDAGFNSTTSSDNTFIGSAAGRQNTTGYRNAFVGNEAGYDNTTGFWNSALGDSALIDSDVGFNNTAVGHGAGCATENADYNTFIGAYAGGDNNRTNSETNANRNTYVGAFSGFSNRVGEDNVGMGTFSGYGGTYATLTGVNGFWGGEGESTNRSRTTFIGAQAAADNNDVVVIGYKARVDGRYGITLGNESRAQQSYSVAIGYGVNVNQANTLALGGDNSGTGAFANNRLSVGIGTVAANRNASLELADTDKGFLVNRLTTAQRVALETAAADGNPIDAAQEGLMVYDTDIDALFTWDGTVWSAAEANTDAQELSVATDVLSISGGTATVDLTPYLDNTDAQELSVATNVLSISGGTATVDLTPYLDNTDAQALTLDGSNNLSISGGNSVDLSGLADGIGTDSQTLTLDGANNLSISGGNSVDLSGLADGTGTDSQNLTSATINASNVLTVEIQNGASVNVDLSPILSALETENANQQAQIDDLLARVTTLEGCACNTLTVGEEDDTTNRSDGPILYQNIPNPFNGTTSIKYFVPLRYKNAAIVFSNTSGQIIDNVALKDLGDQELFFNSDSLASGMYYYTLYVDGRKADTKKMIIE